MIQSHKPGEQPSKGFGSGSLVRPMTGILNATLLAFRQLGLEVVASAAGLAGKRIKHCRKRSVGFAFGRRQVLIQDSRASVRPHAAGHWRCWHLRESAGSRRRSCQCFLSPEARTGSHAEGSCAEHGCHRLLQITVRHSRHKHQALTLRSCNRLCNRPQPMF